MEIAICLLIKDESEYIDEWLIHHRKLGINRFYIYDNHSKYPLQRSLALRDCNIKLWDDRGTDTQVLAYNDCCRNHPEEDFILFIDTDEFLMLDPKFKNIQECIEELQKLHGEFSALGIYWRMYGKTTPYFETRHPITDYVEYFEHSHIKTIVNPKNMDGFTDPHHCLVTGNYIDEKGRMITGPFSNFHTSDMIWIKHIWSRSFAEFQQKIVRGGGDKVNRQYDITHFYDYNDKCIYKD